MKRVMGPLFVLVVSVAAPSSASAQAEALDLFRLGAQELASGMIDKAVGTLERAVAMKPDAKEGWYNLGVAYGRKKVYAKEIQAYRKALDLDPNYVNALHNLGMAQLDIGQKDDGIASLKKAVELAPDAADSWNNLGVALMDTGDLASALEAFRTLVETTPESPEAQFNLGIVLMRLAEKETSDERREPLFREALDANQRALEADSKAYRAAYNRGVIFHALGDIESEIAAYRQALAVRPAYGAALYNLAAAYSLKGDRDQAVASWEAYVKAARSDPAERVFMENARKEVLRLRGL